VTLVVDANVIIALVVADEHQAAARTHFEEWLQSGQDLHAPAVLPYEVANVLARLVFEETLTRDDVNEIWQDLAALDLQLHPFDLTQEGPDIAAVTAQLRRRHATDSVYVCLARRLKTDLWTLDGRLARNAADVGLPVKLVA
jgi:predicted nucleic acid-binding protein